MKKIGISSAHRQLLALMAAGAITLGACATPGGGQPPPTTPTPIPAPATNTPAPPIGGCVDFEDLTLGTTYIVYDTFVDSGVEITVLPFTWSNLTTTNAGFAVLGNGLLAGGSGLEINTNNVSLGFTIPDGASRITLTFGEYGGNLNLYINTNSLNFENFNTLTTIGTVTVTVVNGHGNDSGSLELKGDMQEMGVQSGLFVLIIGGQELWLDDVCWES